MLIVRRLLLLLVVIWTAATLNFFLPRITDQNPIGSSLAQAVSEGGSSGVGIQEMVQAYKKRSGSNQPLWRQYLNFLGDSLRLDFGVIDRLLPHPCLHHAAAGAALDDRPDGHDDADLASCWAQLLGAPPAGAQLAALLHWFAPLMMVFSAIPFYLIGLVLIYFLASSLGWFPSRRRLRRRHPSRNGRGPSPLEVLYHSVLPAFSIIASASVGLGDRHARHDGHGRGRGLHDLRREQGLEERASVLPLRRAQRDPASVTTLALLFGQVVTGAVLVERLRLSRVGTCSRLHQALDYFHDLRHRLPPDPDRGCSMLLVDLIYPLSTRASAPRHERLRGRSRVVRRRRGADWGTLGRRWATPCAICARNPILVVGLALIVLLGARCAGSAGSSSIRHRAAARRAPQPPPSGPSRSVPIRRAATCWP